MQRWLARTLSLAVLALLSSSAFAQYTLTNLTSNVSGQAPFTDPLLINAWGMAYAPGGDFWISDAGSGYSTLYDATGTPQSLQVVIPTATGTGVGSPTGMVYNASQEFKIENWVSAFMFCTLDGTISGWSHFDPNNALIGANNSKSGAVYTGLAITNRTSGNLLYAADAANNKIDVYNGTFQLVMSFTDTGLPAGYTPFNVQDIQGNVVVTFSNGVSGGYVDVFTEAGKLRVRVTHGGPLNQPWGIALAPKNFGSLSNTLLIANNIDNSSTISGYSTKTGKYVGTIRDSSNKPIEIDQLWAIEFGGGSSANGATNQLFFTAGPNNNVNGLFGVIAPN
jgi:uncharacterized protein (TIGR03118 family)